MADNCFPYRKGSVFLGTLLTKISYGLHKMVLSRRQNEFFDIVKNRDLIGPQSQISQV